MVEVQEYVSHAGGQLERSVAFVAPRLHELAGSIGSLLPAIPVVGGIADELIARCYGSFVEQRTGRIEQHPRLQGHTSLLRGNVGIESGQVHRDGPQTVLNGVELAHDVVHTLGERVAGQLKVVVDVEDLIAHQWHTAIALQHLEIEPGANEACLCLQRSVERLLFAQCVHVSILERHHIDAINKNVHLSDERIVVTPFHLRSDARACRVLSQLQFQHIGFAIHVDGQRIVGCRVKIVATHAAMSALEGIVDGAEEAQCAVAHRVGA